MSLALTVAPYDTSISIAAVCPPPAASMNAVAPSFRVALTVARRYRQSKIVMAYIVMAYVVMVCMTMTVARRYRQSSWITLAWPVAAASIRAVSPSLPRALASALCLTRTCV